MWRSMVTRCSWPTPVAATRLCSRSCRRNLSTSWAALNIQRSHIQDLELPTGNLVTEVFKNASRWGDKVATECILTGRRYTYNQMVDRVAKWGGFLRKLGVQRGDVVGVALDNCPEYPIVFYGAIAIGAVATTINPLYSSEEVARQLRNSETKVLVGDPLVEKSLMEATKMYDRPIHLVMNGPSATPGTVDLRQIIEDPTIPFADTISLTGRELAALPYSSGTTGPPKGVSLSHNALTSNIHMFTHPEVGRARETTGDHQETYLCLMPFFHVYGIDIFMNCGLFQGVKLLAMPQFDPKTYVSHIFKNKVETLHLVPPVLNFLVNSPEANKETMSQVRNILCGAAPVPPSAVRALREKIGHNNCFQEGWGMTELLLSTAVPKTVDKIGTIGKLLPLVTGKVVDLSTGETLPAHRDGEICIKSPSMMDGYYNNPAATKETIDTEGWLHTGDVGHFDEEGYFTVVDRTKELIKVKALQVSPSELEDIIRQHPGVLDVGVVGVPHERLGEAPRAFIIAKATLDPADIHSFVNPRVAHHKTLVGGVVFVDSLPKNATGKLLRKQLKEMANS